MLIPHENKTYFKNHPDVNLTLREFIKGQYYEGRKYLMKEVM
jgi:hypothetical protein